MTQYKTSGVFTSADSTTRSQTVLLNGVRVWDGYLAKLFIGDGITPGGVSVGPNRSDGENRLVENQSAAQAFLIGLFNGTSPSVLMSGPSTTNNTGSYPEHLGPLLQSAGAGTITKNGVAGQTWASFLADMNTIKAANPKLLVVDCGYFINELRAANNGGRSIAAGEADFRSAMTQFRAQCPATSNAVLIMSPNTTLPAGGLSDPTLAPDLNYTNLAIAELVCRKVAADYNCVYYDRLNAFPSPFGLPWSDGIHPGNPYSKAIASEAFEAVVPYAYRNLGGSSGTYLGAVTADMLPGAYPEGLSYAFAGGGFPFGGLLTTFKAPNTGLPYPVIHQTVSDLVDGTYYGITATRAAGAANNASTGWKQWGYSGKGPEAAVVVNDPWIRPTETNSNPLVYQIEGENTRIRGALQKLGNGQIAANELLCNIPVAPPLYDTIIDIWVFDGATWENIPGFITSLGNVMALKGTSVVAGVNKVHINATWKRNV